MAQPHGFFSWLVSFSARFNGNAVSMVLGCCDFCSRFFQFSSSMSSSIEVQCSHVLFWVNKKRCWISKNRANERSCYQCTKSSGKRHFSVTKRSKLFLNFGFMTVLHEQIVFCWKFINLCPNVLHTFHLFNKNSVFFGALVRSENLWTVKIWSGTKDFGGAHLKIGLRFKGFQLFLLFFFSHFYWNFLALYKT